MASVLVEIIGWIGAGLVLIAYYLITKRKISGDSKSYQYLNLVGAIFILINSYFNQAFPSVGINIIWIGIAIYGFWRIYRVRK